MENVKIVEKKKKTILVLCDHPLSTSGVGTQARYLLTGLLDTGEYRIKCFGAAVKHADYKTVSVPPTSAAWEPGDFIIKPIDGFGDTNMMRQVLATEKPDALFIFTDPRFFIWLWEMEEEIHQVCPIVYWHVWDNLPWPEFNRVLYESTDLINCHSYLTYKMVHEHFPEKTNFIPHAVPQEIFHPLSPAVVADFKKRLLPPDRQDHFVSFWINRNAKRKRSNDLLEAWKLFMDMLEKKHGHRKATLLMHTDPFDQAGSNLVATSEMLGIQNDVIFSKDRILFEDVAVMHNISDVVVNISCFPGEQRVATSRGYVPIKDVVIDDFVLTHMGRWRKVTRTIKHQAARRDALTLKTTNCNPVVCTNDHKLMVIKRSNLPKGFLFTEHGKTCLEYAHLTHASDISIGDYVVATYDKFGPAGVSVEFDFIKYIKQTFTAECVIEDGRIRSKFREYDYGPAKIQLTPDVAYVLGNWTADGSTHSASVAFDNKHPEKIEKYINAVKSGLGMECIVHQIKNHTNVNIKYGAIHSKWFVDVCGEYSEGKCVPEFIIAADSDIRRAYLAGYLAGDGCVMKDERWTTSLNRIRTISPKIALGLRRLLVSLGYTPNVVEGSNSRGYNKNGRIWTIEWRDRLRENNGSCRSWNFDGTVVSRVLDISSCVIDDEVYDLTVDEDHTYVVENIGVSNCNEGFGLGTLEAMQCGTPIIALKTGGLTRQVVDHRDGSENGIALPVEVQTLVGSQLCPYIYEDYCSNQTIADALLKMFDMGNEERERLGEKARQYVLSEFSLSKTVADWHTTLSTTIETWKSNKASIYRPVEIVKL